MQQFPYPKHKTGSEGDVLADMIPTMAINAFIFFIINLVKRVIEEKSNGSKVILSVYIHDFL